MKYSINTIVAILMVLAMASILSLEVFAEDNPGSNSAPTAKSAPAPTAAPSVNPPHGQPGHTCDHGKPGHVCSAPSGPQPIMPQGSGATLPTATPLNVPAQTTTSATAPGMNPPHGQPNHRCDIGVGMPLDAPAGTGKTVPTISSQQTPIQIKPGQSSIPIQANPAQSSSAPAAPGMNPPHGQPNHRCDIGVGVPLDSPAGTGKSSPTTGASSSTKHVHNMADSSNSAPIRIVPAPQSGGSGK